MKEIKIRICDYDPHDPWSYGRFIIDRLKRFYEVVLSDNPDYVFFHERATGYLDHPRAIRIFYTGENIHPNFNLADYAISFDKDGFDGRNFRLPLYLVPGQYYEETRQLGEDPDFEQVKPMTKKELRTKSGFCSFVYSNNRADPNRDLLFDALSAYKKVDSGGKHRNNVGGPVASKFVFEHSHKFSIAFENSSRTGYITEKLPGSLAARTIPIYFGDPNIGDEFNTARIINAHDFPDFAAVVARVKEIDENDDEYMRIVNQPVLANGYHPEAARREFDAFLRSIFDQPLADARRIRINTTHQAELEQKERFFARLTAAKGHLRPFVAPLCKLLR